MVSSTARAAPIPPQSLTPTGWHGPRPGRIGPFACYVAALVLVTVVAFLEVTRGGQIREAAHEPSFWLLACLGLLLDTRAFIAIGRKGRPVTVSPSLCFSFAILLCFGLGPAVLVQVAAAAVVGWRLRRRSLGVLVMIGQYAVASTVAYLVLVTAGPGPLSPGGTEIHLLTGAAASHAVVGFIGAIGAWLLTYQLLRILAICTWRGRRRVVPLRLVPTHESLPTLALLLLAPSLAAASHVSLAFVPLVAGTLVTLAETARLSTERHVRARLDPLTGLASRPGLAAVFDWQQLREENPRLALLMLDLNRFKQVNDTLGHDAGDRLLVEVGSRLREVVPDGACAARLGGDEFAILITAPDGIGDARRLAESVHAAFATPVDVGGAKLHLGGAIGIALSPQHGTDFQSMLRCADAAMYRAKQYQRPTEVAERAGETTTASAGE